MEIKVHMRGTGIIAESLVFFLRIEQILLIVLKVPLAFDGNLFFYPHFLTPELLFYRLSELSAWWF